jgi:hypothetical protein
MRTLITAILSVAASALLTVQAADVTKPDSMGYIRDWLMLAPIPLPEGRAGSDLILERQIKDEGTLQPKAGDTVKINGKELTWKPITASTNYFDFNSILKNINDHAVGYMVTYIECEQEMPGVIIAVGSNDQARIYFNGVDIYAVSEARQLELDGDKGRVTFKKGVNIIIFKVLNEQNSWQGAMRFLDKSGTPLTNLKIKLSP